MKNMVLGGIFSLIFLEVINIKFYNLKTIDARICCFTVIILKSNLIVLYLVLNEIYYKINAGFLLRQYLDLGIFYFLMPGLLRTTKLFTFKITHRF
jgi:hypothetical protein